MQSASLLKAFKIGLPACLCFLASVAPLPAAVLMKADFSVGKDLTTGASPTGTLVGGATVSGGALQVGNTAPSGVTYGTVNNYLDVSNTSWGNNTIIATFSLDSAGNTRQTLFSTSGDNANGILFFANVDNGTRGIRLAFYRGNNENATTLWLNNSKPKTNTDYFVAASWQDTGTSLSVTLYLRELDDLTGETTLYQTFTTAEPTGGSGMASSSTQTVNLGHRNTADALNGDIYLFQTYNTFTNTQNDFNTLFTTVAVPEPGAMALLSAAGVALMGFRRLRSNRA
jgi:hypothetical protein